MHTAIQFGDTISDNSQDSSLFLYEIDPIKNKPSTAGRKYTDRKYTGRKSIDRLSKVSDRDGINFKLYATKRMAGPDPSEEEQRDRTSKEKINTEEDKHKEKPDHSEEDIYDTDSDQKEKDKKNSHN
jgi:hypothetical protein